MLWDIYRATLATWRGSIVSLFWLTGTYCQQREVEAITEDVEGDDGKLPTSEIVSYYELDC